MKIIVTKVGSGVAGIDLIPYLMPNAGSGCILTQELERMAFQRTLDDISLTLSDMRGVLTTFFGASISNSATATWQLEVFSDTRRIFLGFVQNTLIRFSFVDQTCMITAFSANKDFWERAKNLRLSLPQDQAAASLIIGNTFNKAFVTLGEVFYYEAAATNLSNGGLLYTGIDLGRFTSRRVRWWASQADANLTGEGYDATGNAIGDEGRFRDLNPETTWDDFLQACALQFNAEFWIEPSTGKLMMGTRADALQPISSAKDLDAILKSDSEIEEAWLDDRKVDWLYALSLIPQPQPKLRAFYAPPGAIDLGFWVGEKVAYLSTAVVGDREICTSASVVIDVEYPGFPQMGLQIWMYVPPTPVPGATSQNLYRYVDTAGYVPLYYCVKAGIPVSGDVYQDFKHTWDPNHPLPDGLSNWFRLWENYNQFGGGWTTVYDTIKGAQPPSGIVLDVYPQLSFRVNEQDIQYDPFWVFCLFAKSIDFSSTTIRDDWVSMFRIRQAITAHVKGTDFRLGDTFKSQYMTHASGRRNLALQIVLRKAAIDLVKEETELVLVTA